MIFCLRQLQEKCIEQDRPLYMIFVDFSKAFDTVSPDGALFEVLYQPNSTRTSQQRYKLRAIIK